jgi:hypothetical protein
MKFYIGYDHNEHAAVMTAQHSLERVSDFPQPELLVASKLIAQGMLTRITDKRGGQPYDLVSNAPKSTEFAVSRFLVPLICQERWALFTDCDVVFLEDPRTMLTEIDPGFPVYVVKHDYLPKDGWKMVNQKQTVYPRKNWSSVMLFDCLHPANWRLSLRDINERPGRDLHGFYWLNDNEIGRLDARWNWLVGEQECALENAGRGIAHFTLGGPWLPGWRGAPHDDVWLDAARRAGVPTFSV